MRKAIRLILLTLVMAILLLAASILALPDGSLAAQEEPSEEGPEAFVPTEELPSDAAVSFPTDI